MPQIDPPTGGLLSRRTGGLASSASSSDSSPPATQPRPGERANPSKLAERSRDYLTRARKEEAPKPLKGVGLSSSGSAPMQQVFLSKRDAPVARSSSGSDSKDDGAPAMASPSPQGAAPPVRAMATAQESLAASLQRAYDVASTMAVPVGLDWPGSDWLENVRKEVSGLAAISAAESAVRAVRGVTRARRWRERAAASARAAENTGNAHEDDGHGSMDLEGLEAMAEAMEGQGEVKGGGAEGIEAATPASEEADALAANVPALDGAKIAPLSQANVRMHTLSHFPALSAGKHGPAGRTLGMPGVHRDGPAITVEGGARAPPAPGTPRMRPAVRQPPPGALAGSPGQEGGQQKEARGERAGRGNTSKPQAMEETPEQKAARFRADYERVVRQRELQYLMTHHAKEVDVLTHPHAHPTLEMPSAPPPEIITHVPSKAGVSGAAQAERQDGELPGAPMHSSPRAAAVDALQGAPSKGRAPAGSMVASGGEPMAMAGAPASAGGGVVPARRLPFSRNASAGSSIIDQ